MLSVSVTFELNLELALDRITYLHDSCYSDTQPLKLIAGKPMIYHTYPNAAAAKSVRIPHIFRP
eukprot:8147794-Pyramimonas_sp.AAC.2